MTMATWFGAGLLLGLLALALLFVSFIIWPPRLTW